MDVKPLYIDGTFRPAASGEFLEVRDPFTGEVFAQVSAAGAEDIDHAVGAAARAFQSGSWPAMEPAQRGHCLDQIARGLKKRLSALARCEVQDAGSTLKKAAEDVFLSIKCFEHYAQLARDFQFETELAPFAPSGRSRNLIRREPIGVCGAIIPWNFPLKMAAWKIAPALATGNTLVLKPSEEAPLSALMLAEIIDATDLPKGVVNILPGRGELAGAALAGHPLIDKLAFTGSTRVGAQVMAQAAAGLKKVTLECGGKSANIVLDDVAGDLDWALDGALYAMFYHAGQCCEAGTRLFLPHTLRDSFLTRLAEKIGRMKLGDPRERDTLIGPLISRRQQQRVQDYIALGLREGAELLVGGTEIEDPRLRSGYFVAPTVFTGVKPAMRIAREEIFGPVLCVLDYGEEAELIEMVNDSPYGLAAGIWSRDGERAHRLAGRIRAGTVWINDYHLIDERAPFGGYKQSGIGREFGAEGFLEFTETKHIHIAAEDDPGRAARYKTVVPD